MKRYDCQTRAGVSFSTGSSHDQTTRRVTLKNRFLVVRRSTNTKTDHMKTKRKQIDERQGNSAEPRVSSGPDLAASTSFRKESFGTTVLRHQSDFTPTDDETWICSSI